MLLEVFINGGEAVCAFERTNLILRVPGLCSRAAEKAQTERRVSKNDFFLSVSCAVIAFRLQGTGRIRCAF